MTRRDPWVDDPAHPVDDWKTEIANDDTRLGYLEWIDARAENDASDSGSIRPAVRTMREAVRIRATDRMGNVAYIHREANRPMRCTLANGVSAALFYAGIRVDEATCRFALDDCATADQALAIVRRYGSLDYGYCHAGPPPGLDTAHAIPAALVLLSGLIDEIDRVASLSPQFAQLLDAHLVGRARTLVAMDGPPPSTGA